MAGGTLTTPQQQLLQQQHTRKQMLIAEQQKRRLLQAQQQQIIVPSGPTNTITAEMSQGLQNIDSLLNNTVGLFLTLFFPLSRSVFNIVPLNLFF